MAASVAAQLKPKGYYVVSFAFAEPLKQACQILFGTPSLERCEADPGLKDNPTSWQWEDLAPAIRTAYPGRSGTLTVREIWQLFGTEVIRNGWATDAWVQILKRKVAESYADVIFITDVRFPNELQAIRDMGGKFWEIAGRAGGESGAGHASETSLAGHTPDLIINNTPGTSREVLVDQALAAIELEG